MQIKSKTFLKRASKLKIFKLFFVDAKPISFIGIKKPSLTSIENHYFFKKLLFCTNLCDK